MSIANRLAKIEQTSRSNVDVTLLRDLDAFQSIIGQYTKEQRDTMSSHLMYKLIRVAQSIRMKHLHGTKSTKIHKSLETLTEDEMVYVYVYERDMLNGVLREFVNDTMYQCALVYIDLWELE